VQHDSLSPSLVVLLEEIKPKNYNSQWLNEAVTDELNVDNAFRRQALLQSTGELFNDFTQEWKLFHSANLNEHALVEILQFKRRGYKLPSIELTIMSNTKEIEGRPEVIIGMERPITKVTAFEEIESFCKQHPTGITDKTVGYCKSILSKMIGAAGSEHQITMGAGVSGLADPNIRLKVKRTRLKHDFSMGLLILSSTRVGRQ